VATSTTGQKRPHEACRRPQTGGSPPPPHCRMCRNDQRMRCVSLLSPPSFVRDPPDPVASLASQGYRPGWIAPTGLLDASAMPLRSSRVPAPTLSIASTAPGGAGSAFRRAHRLSCSSACASRPPTTPASACAGANVTRAYGRARQYTRTWANPCRPAWEAKAAATWCSDFATDVTVAVSATCGRRRRGGKAAVPRRS